MRPFNSPTFFESPAAAVSDTAARSLPRDISSRFGRRLRELRRERNLTQLQVSVNFGIDRSFLSDVETGKKSLSLPFLELIARGLNLTLSDLLQDL